MMHQHYYNGRPHNYKWMTSIIYIYRYMTLCLEGVVSPRSRCRVSCRHGRTAACRVAVVAPPPVVLLPMPSCCRVLCHRRVCCPSCCGRAAAAGVTVAWRRLGLVCAAYTQNLKREKKKESWRLTVAARVAVTLLCVSPWRTVVRCVASTLRLRCCCCRCAAAALLRVL